MFCIHKFETTESRSGILSEKVTKKCKKCVKEKSEIWHGGFKW